MKTFDEEVMEVIDDAEHLSNEEWNKKYGDRTYWEVIKQIVRTRLDSCPKQDILVANTKYEWVKAICEAHLHRAFNFEGKGVIKNDE